MSTNIVSMFMMVLKYSAATYLDSTWRPPGVSVGCTDTPTPRPVGCAISSWAYIYGAVTSYSCSGVQ